MTSTQRSIQNMDVQFECCSEYQMATTSEYNSYRQGQEPKIVSFCLAIATVSRQSTMMSKKKGAGAGGQHSTDVAYLILTRQPRVWFPRIFLFMLLIFIDGTA